MHYTTLLKLFLQFHRLTTPYSGNLNCMDHIKFSLMVAVSAYAVMSLTYLLTIPGNSATFYFEMLFKVMECSFTIFYLLELRIKRHNLVDFIQFLNEPLHQFGPTFSDQEIINEFTFALKFIGILYSTAVGFFFCTRVGTPLVFLLLNYPQTKLVDMPLPVGFIPIETDSYVLFFVFFLLGTLYILVQDLVYGIWALSFAYGSFKLVAQLKILNLSLLKLNYHIDHRYMVVSELAHSGASSFNEDLYEHCVFECLKESIRVHQKILGHRKLLEDWFTRTTLIFSQVFTFHMAFQAIQLSSINQFQTGSALLGAALNVTLSMGQLFALSFCGQIIINESENLLFTLYNCPWLEKPKMFKKNIIIMMEVASRPIRLTACGLYALEMQLVYNTVCAAYSFFNVLVSVNNR